MKAVDPNRYRIPPTNDPLVEDMRELLRSMTDAQVRRIGELLDPTQLGVLGFVIERATDGQQVSLEHRGFLMSLRPDQVDALADVLAEDQLRRLVGVSRSATA